MTNEEILKKAIEKAEKNDYKCPDVQGYYFEIIYSHDFGKAFWGEEFTKKEKNGYTFLVLAYYPGDDMLELSDPGCVWFRGKRWQYHLQQMVISEDPIKYLEAFL